MSFIDWELENFPQNFCKLRCNEVIDRQTLTHVICNMDSPEGVERDVFARVMSEVAKTLDKVPFCEIERQSEWISVKDRLPESGEKVIARLQSKTFQSYRPTTILAHIGEHEKTTDDSDWRDRECDTEYDEKNDCYWISECWYEVNVVDDNPNWIIDSDYNVTHWMPLPEPPKEEAK